MRSLPLVMLLQTMAHGATGGQSGCPPDTPPRPPGAYRLCDLSRPPTLITDTVTGQYPEMLRQAGINGDVRLGILVDSVGIPDPVSIVVLASSNRAFERTARAAARTLRFVPGRQAGAAVIVYVPVNVDFVLPEPHTTGPDLRPKQTVNRAALSGTGVTVRIGHEIVPQTAPLPQLGAEAIDAVRRGVALAVLPLIERLPEQVACIAFDGRIDPDAETLATLTDQFPNLAPRSTCPHTYATMLGLLDRQGRRIKQRPAGAIDPVVVNIGPLLPWTAELVAVGATRTTGTSGSWFACEARRQPDGWHASCRSAGRSWVN